MKLKSVTPNPEPLFRVDQLQLIIVDSNPGSLIASEVEELITGLAVELNTAVGGVETSIFDLDSESVLAWVSATDAITALLFKNGLWVVKEGGTLLEM